MKINCSFVVRKLTEQQIDHTEDFHNSIVIISQFGSKHDLRLDSVEKAMPIAILVLPMCSRYFECVVQLKS